MYFSPEFRGDREIVFIAVQEPNYGDVILENVSIELRDDFEIVLAAVRVKGCAFQNASKRLKANREIALCAAHL
jgi:hypothetical protein